LSVLASVDVFKEICATQQSLWMYHTDPSGMCSSHVYAVKFLGSTDNQNCFD